MSETAPEKNVEYAMTQTSWCEGVFFPPRHSLRGPTSSLRLLHGASVVHEPSRLEPGSSRAGSSPSSPGVPRARAGSSPAWTRLEPARVSWHPALGGSNRGRRADLSPLATRAGSDRGPRADSTLDSSLLAVSWRFLGGFLEARAGS